ncbi:MAG: cytochrome c3 family protein [Thiohalomonas sp.]|nr:cytochrome c3 family protein [Thiohalomonas sp.]
MFKFLMILMTVKMVFCSTLAFSDSQSARNDTITLKKPPEVLAKWYKPANKRQVWLHTMSRLRREILAMNDYSQQKKQAELEKWSQKFIKDYKSIAEMVPQWEKFLYLDKLSHLENAVKQREYSSIAPILKKISKSCMHCHDDYQTVATLMFRSLDFNNKVIAEGFSGEKISYNDIMKQLSDLVNRINIAIKDAYFSTANEIIEPLEQQLEHLSSSCGDCHQDDEVPVERIMSASASLLPELAEQLELKEQKQSGRKLGEFALKVCAKCHSIHKLSSDLKFLTD